jgi:PBSX family phage terminase large subunit
VIETEERKLTWGDLVDPDDPTKGKYYPLHKHQKAIYDSNARFTAAIAGTGGGKTVTGPLVAAKKITEFINKRENKGRQFLGMVVAPTYKVLQRATVPTLIQTFKDTVFEGTYKEQKNLYVLPNDWGLIWCQGADNPGGLEGGQFDFIWGDEAGQFKQSVWNAIQGRTGAKQAPILLTTTPYSKNWLYSEVVLNWQKGDPNYFVEQWASYYNPAYPKEEYERAKRTMSKDRAAMRYDGLFTNLEGLVYPEMGRCFVEMDINEIQKLINSPGKAVGGIDFGWNDPFSAHCGHLDRNDTLWIWYERYKRRTTIEEHSSALPKLYNKSVTWYADHSEPEQILKLRKSGHRVKKANKSITAGIVAVNARILTDKLKIIVNRCPAIRAEAEVYAYTDNEDDLGTDKPIDEFNHACDSLRYLVAGIDLKKPA